MIRVNDIPLLCPSDPDAERYPVNLSDLLFSPGTSLPSSTVGTAPPPMPPYRVEYAPGTLYWPQGASRFAVGQYLVTDQEAQAIRLIVLEDPITNHLTLKLGGSGEGWDTGQDEVTFQMHLLHLIPLQLDRAATPEAERAVYLMILVDYRYFFQTLAPDWSVTDQTSWEELDEAILLFLPAGSTADAVDADYLQPGTDLAPPELATDGVVGWAGPLLDAICLASGRRFVANTNGTFTLQGLAATRSAHSASHIANIPRRRFGGRLAFPPEDEETQGLVVVPDSLLFVFPEESGGTTEVAPYTKQVTFDSVKTAAGLTADVPLREGELVIPTTLWSDNVNTPDLDAWAERFATDWYGFLSAPTVQVYSGAVDFPPDGFTDVTVWKVCADDVWTRVYRGLFNPRPHVVCGYSGIDPPTPPPPSVTLFNETLAPTVATAFTSLRALDSTGVRFLLNAGTLYDLQLLAASLTQMGAVTVGSQSWTGPKTNVSDFTVSNGNLQHTGTGAVQFAGATAILNTLTNTANSANYRGNYVSGNPIAEFLCSTAPAVYWRLKSDGGGNVAIGSYRLEYGSNIVSFVIDWDALGTTNNVRYGVANSAGTHYGVSGTGGGGDTVVGGIITALGAGGGGITTIVIPGPTSITGTSVEFIAGTGISITSPGAGQIEFASTVSGTVTSVAMTVPSFLSVAGSPITTSGTLAVTLATQSANTVFAGPTSGGAAAPTFRALVADDLPVVPATKGGTGQSSYAVGDLLYADTTTSLAKLAAGVNGKYLRLTAGVPVWTAIPGELLGWDATDADESTNSATPVALTTADEITWSSIEAENVIVEYHAQTYNTGVANNSVRLLLDGGSVTTRTQGQPTANIVTTIHLICRFAVSSGSHTIAMRYFCDANTSHWLFRTLRVYRG